MNAHEAAAVLGRMVAAWPGTRWTEEAEDLWLRDLVSYTPEEALAAVEHCRRTLDRQPSWHQFLEAMTHVRKDLARRASERALSAGPNPAPAAARKRLAAIVRGMRGTMERFTPMALSRP